MKKWIVPLCGLLITTSVFANNFPNEFLAAHKLYSIGKAVDAEKAFLTLSEQAGKENAYGKDECMAYAMKCALAGREYDKALGYLEKIKHKKLKMLCQMTLLQKQRKLAEIIQLSKDEELEKWPDRFIYEIAMIRGNAHASLKNKEAAEKDFLLARNSTLSLRSQTKANSSLVNLYRGQFKDEAKALAAENEITGIRCAQGIDQAELFTRMSRFPVALKILDRLKVETVKSPEWECRIYSCYGDIYAASNNIPEALRNYKRAAASKAPEAIIKAVKEKISTLK